MNPIQLLNKIKIQLDELSNLSNQFLSENKQPSSLDKELLKKQCIALYDSISKLNTSADTHAIEESHETKTNPASMEEFEIKEANILSDKPEHIIVQPVNEIIKEEVQADSEISNTNKSIPEQDLFSKSPVEKKSNRINVPASELSLYEKILVKKQADVHERINESKLESLKAAIGLNKKIAFVNELFKENTVDYAKAIDKLNSSPDLNEALKYFNELKHQYSWSNDNELIIELEELIQKRFR